MAVHTLSRDRYSALTLRGPVAADEIDIAGAKRPQRDASAHAQPASLDALTVVLCASEPHRDVAVRAQLLVREAAVSRAALLLTKPAAWHRLLHRLPGLRSAADAPDTEVSARVLGAGFSPQRLRIETCAGADAIATNASGSDLVVVGRRRRSPWGLVPLARHARLLLRRACAPVLIVGGPPSGAYRKVIVATDLRTDPGPALQWARRVAPQAPITLLHVYRGPLEGTLALAGAADDDILRHRLDALRKAASGMKALLHRHRGTAQAMLTHGGAIDDVLRKASELDADLIVVVRSMHSWWAEAFGASVSAEIAARAERDVLVVHAPASQRFGMPAPANREKQ
jgi:nucleotide-binding universal stress UspA family protein